MLVRFDVAEQPNFVQEAITETQKFLCGRTHPRQPYWGWFVR